MQPIFPKWTNRIPFVLGIGIPLFIFLIVIGIWYYFSPKFLAVGYEPNQPIMFSHQIHAGKVGLDCRYCHSSVDKAAYAALPPTDTCMGCHNKVLRDSPRLKLLRDHYENKTPIEWVHVYSLPRYAHFDHSAHLNVGVGCVNCHGRVDKMDTIKLETPLSMGWCLECHRNPTQSLGPKSEVTNLLYDVKSAGYVHNKDKSRDGEIIQPPTSCGACHY